MFVVFAVVAKPLHLFMYLRTWQSDDGGGGGGNGAYRGCHAAIASFDTEHFLFNFHASHAYPDGALPPLFRSVSSSSFTLEFIYTFSRAL